MAKRGKWTPEALRARGYLPLDEISTRLLDEGIIIARDKASVRRLQVAGALKVRTRRAGVDALSRNVAFYPPETIGKLRKIFYTKLSAPQRKGYALTWLRRQPDADQIGRAVDAMLQTAPWTPDKLREMEEEEKGLYRHLSPEDRDAVIAATRAALQDPETMVAVQVQMDVVDDRIPAADVLNTGIEAALTPDSITRIYGDRVTGDRPYWPVVVSVLQALTNQVRNALAQRNETEAFWVVTQMSKALAGLRASLQQPQPAAEPTTEPVEVEKE